MKASFQNVFCLVLMCVAMNISAQDVSITAQGPKVVSEGERFRFSYSVNAQGSNFKPGNLEGFSVLSGPSLSRSSSVKIINGQVTQSVENSYNYVLVAKKEGTYTISPGSITVEGKEYTSNSVTIEVVKGEKPATKPQNQSGSSGSNAQVSSDDIFMRLLVSKREALKGEPIVATLKLYTRLNLSNLGNFKAPAYNGFWTESLRKASNIELQRENVNGTIYNTAVIQQDVLIPERSGELTIDPAELTAIVQVQSKNNRQRGIFGFRRYENVEKSLRSSPVKIKVNPLPTGAPVGFAGAVGDIDLSADLSAQETKTNEAVSLKVTYSGTGNLKLISEPKIQFPTDFEVYDPKISNNYKATSKGFTGRKTYEYLVIPRHEGDYEIPAIQLAVFDLATKSYKNLTAGPFSIHVEKGEGSSEVVAIDPGLIKEDVQVLGSDIRYLKTNDIILRKKDRPFFGSASFFLSYLLSLGAFLFLVLLVRRQRKRNEDEVYVKNKKAGRIAQARLKKAKQFLDQGQRDAFYKEVLNAQWGYLSDKLNVPQGELNREKVRGEFANRQVDETLVAEWMEFMNRCEFAQFAPGNGEGELSGVYDEAAALIGKLNVALR